MDHTGILAAVSMKDTRGKPEGGIHAGAALERRASLGLYTKGSRTFEQEK
jgi:predicted amidohydrolase YtcJ